MYTHKTTYQRQFPIRMALHQAHHAFLVQLHDNAQLSVLERGTVHLTYIVTAYIYIYIYIFMCICISICTYIQTYQRQFPIRVTLHQAHHALLVQLHDNAQLSILERGTVHLTYIVTAHGCHEQDPCLSSEHGHFLFTPCGGVLFNCHGMLLAGLAELAEPYLHVCMYVCMCVYVYGLA